MRAGFVICPNCGERIPLRNREEEGDYRTARCPKCGQRNNASNRHCGRCGEPIGERKGNHAH